MWACSPRGLNQFAACVVPSLAKQLLVIARWSCEDLLLDAGSSSLEHCLSLSSHYFGSPKPTPEASYQLQCVLGLDTHFAEGQYPFQASPPDSLATR
jgi:hypothetical protein